MPEIEDIGQNVLSIDSTGEYYENVIVEEKIIKTQTVDKSQDGFTEILRSLKGAINDYIGEKIDCSIVMDECEVIAFDFMEDNCEIKCKVSTQDRNGNKIGSGSIKFGGTAPSSKSGKCSINWLEGLLENVNKCVYM